MVGDEWLQNIISDKRYLEASPELVQTMQKMQSKHHFPQYWSFDNDNVHNKRRLMQEVGVPKQSILDVPPYSPDFQQPIEHAWNRVKTVMQQAFDSPSCKIKTVEGAIKLLQKAWKEQTTPAVVAKDVQLMGGTMKWVAENHGQFPPKKLRYD